ncbi:hypothetical protein AB0F43_14290 [Kribbella sp. NPDC023972]|uniref:hypothetical protein n=1 Tax=Kribbella sp. NPDC023972 TaxID=3154795 RepID=UPI003400CAF5
MKVPAMLCGLGLLVAAPTASADSPTRILNTITSVSCVFETARGDYVFFGATANTLDAASGSYMFVETADYDMVAEGWEGTAVFAGDGSFAADVELLDSDTEEPLGLASVEATRTLLAAPVTEDLQERSGNSWTIGTVTTTEYRVDVGSATMPGQTVLAGDDDCISEVITYDVMTTNPAAAISSDSDFESAICDLEGLPNGQVALSQDRPGVRYDVVIDDGVNPQEAEGVLNLPGRTAGGTSPLIDHVTGQQIGELTINVELRRIGARSQQSDTFDGITERGVVVPYLATITVSTSDGRSSVARCYAEDYTSKLIVRPSANDGGH